MKSLVQALQNTEGRQMTEESMDCDSVKAEFQIVSFNDSNKKSFIRNASF
jgi:hypothetical protein